MTNMLVRPAYQQIRNLPAHIKARLLDQYSKWEHSQPLEGNWNPRDPNRYKEHIDNEITAIINALKLDNNTDQTEELYSKLALWHWLDDEEIAKYFT